MASSRDRSGDSLVVLPPATAGALSAAERHVVAAITGVPSALLEREGRAGRAVFLSAHRGAHAARREAASLARQGVTAEVHGPGAGATLLTSLAAGGTTGAVGLVLALLVWLAGAPAWLALAVLVLGAATGPALLAFGRQVDPTTVDRDTADAARERMEALSTRAPEAWHALAAAQRAVRDADLPPEAAADLWRALDRAGDALLAGAQDDAFVARLAEIEAVLSQPDSAASRGSEAAQRAVQAARAGSAAQRAVDDG